MVGMQYARRKYNNRGYLNKLKRTQGVYTQKADKYNRLGAKPMPFRCTLRTQMNTLTSGNQTYIHYYALSDFTAYGTSLANLFDQYKLAGLKAKLLSLNPVDFLNYGSSYTMGLQFNCLDYSEGSTAYSTADDILQLDTVMIKRIDQGWTRYFRPKTASTNETSNYPTIYDDEQPFLSTANTGVNHYSLKFLFEAPGGVVANLTPEFELFETYFWLFKNQNS